MAREGAPARVELQRDKRGFPTKFGERQKHIAARTDFVEAMTRERPDEWVSLLRHYDAEDPAHYVEWARLRRENQSG